MSTEDVQFNNLSRQSLLARELSMQNFCQPLCACHIMLNWIPYLGCAVFTIAWHFPFSKINELIDLFRRGSFVLLQVSKIQSSTSLYYIATSSMTSYHDRHDFKSEARSQVMQNVKISACRQPYGKSAQNGHVCEHVVSVPCVFETSMRWHSWEEKHFYDCIIKIAISLEFDYCMLLSLNYENKFLQVLTRTILGEACIGADLSSIDREPYIQCGNKHYTWDPPIAPFPVRFGFSRLRHKIFWLFSTLTWCCLTACLEMPDVTGGSHGRAVKVRLVSDIWNLQFTKIIRRWCMLLQGHVATIRSVLEYKSRFDVVICLLCLTLPKL